MPCHDSLTPIPPDRHRQPSVLIRNNIPSWMVICVASYSCTNVQSTWHEHASQQVQTMSCCAWVQCHQGKTVVTLLWWNCGSAVSPFFPIPLHSCLAPQICCQEPDSDVRGKFATSVYSLFSYLHTSVWKEGISTVASLWENTTCLDCHYWCDHFSCNSVKTINFTACTTLIRIM